MKIGILTFQYAYNYGALLQAYGLCSYLEKFGHDVRFINYLPQSFSAQQKYRQLKRWVRELLKQRHDMPLHILKRFQFDRFRQHFLPLTRLCSTREELEDISLDFDSVIVGSDQVWNGHFIRNVASHYFLDFTPLKKCRRISYAASFGDVKEKQPAETIETAKRHLRHFNSISVRDQISAKIVRDLSGRQADIVLDPSLLHDFEDISGCRGNSEQGYIASYYISDNHAQLGRTVLDHLSDRIQLPIILIGNRMRAFGKYKALIPAGPLEWLRFFREASFICADSFHATVFSVKFRKPFITWCGNRPERARDFLKLCGLEKRQISKSNLSDIDEIIDTPIDYDAVSEKLKPHISYSQSFLEKAIAV